MYPVVSSLLLPYRSIVILSFHRNFALRTPSSGLYRLQGCTSCLSVSCDVRVFAMYPPFSTNLQAFVMYRQRIVLQLNSYASFFTIKPTTCTNFTNLFWHETLHISDSSSVHHQEFIHCTVHSAMVYAIQVCRACSCLQTCMTYHCWVYSE
jgi:UDP-N-acetylglucosamine 2-epimerase